MLLKTHLWEERFLQMECRQVISMNSKVVKKVDASEAYLRNPLIS